MLPSCLPAVRPAETRPGWGGSETPLAPEIRFCAVIWVSFAQNGSFALRTPRSSEICKTGWAVRVSLHLHTFHIAYQRRLTACVQQGFVGL